MMSGRLSGKVCVITGTGGSVGRSAALAFANEDAVIVGCDVNVPTAEATVEMVRAQGGTMISLQPCHLTKPADCQALVDFAIRTYGRIDVLFNNAAMAYFNWLEDITDDEWNRDLREEIDLVARIPGGDKAKFDAAVKAAEIGCPVSKLFKAEISVSARLES